MKFLPYVTILLLFLIFVPTSVMAASCDPTKLTAKQLADLKLTDVITAKAKEFWAPTPTNTPATTSVAKKSVDAESNFSTSTQVALNTYRKYKSKALTAMAEIKNATPPEARNPQAFAKAKTILPATKYYLAKAAELSLNNPWLLPLEALALVRICWIFL